MDPHRKVLEPQRKNKRSVIAVTAPRVLAASADGAEDVAPAAGIPYDGDRR
jgi:hypothetical protein